MRIFGCLALLLGLGLWCGCGGLGGPEPSTFNPESVAPRVETQAGPVRVSLNAGWNPLGLVVDQVTSLQSTSSVAGFFYYSAGSYQTGNLTAQELNDFGGTRRGIWVYATAPTEIAYSGTDPTEVSMLLMSGWNLVNFPGSGTIPAASLVVRRLADVVPLNSVLLPQFIALVDTTTRLTVDVGAGDSLQAGRMHWIYSMSPVTLSYRVGGAPSPTASPSPLFPVPMRYASPTASPPRLASLDTPTGGYQTVYDLSRRSIEYTSWSKNSAGELIGRAVIRWNWSAPPQDVNPGRPWNFNVAAALVENSYPPNSGQRWSFSAAAKGVSLFPADTLVLDSDMRAPCSLARTSTNGLPSAAFTLELKAPSELDGRYPAILYNYFWNGTPPAAGTSL